jgi:protoporphyrinogen/coproporphyrinogen III oxidase
MLSPSAKLKVGRLAADMLRARRALSYEDLSSAGAFDTETPKAYAIRRGLSGEVYDYLIEPIVRAGAGVPADVISVVEFFFLAQKVLGTELYAFQGGYSSFARRLAEGFELRLGATVTEVVESRDEVRLTWEDAEGEHIESAAGVIVSSMGNTVPDLVPQLGSERATFLRNLTYTSCITFSLGLGRRPTEKAAFVVAPRTVSNKIFAAIIEHNKAPGRAPEGKGLVTIYGMNGWSVENIDRTDDEIIADAMPDAEKLVPGLSADIEFSMVHRWYPVLVYSHPGLYRELGRFHAARPRESRIHLAGSYNSSSNVNTATVAGERAARELADRLAGRIAPATTPLPPTAAPLLS